MSTIFLDNIAQFETLFNVVIGGIENHLDNCEPDPEYILDSLLSLDDHLLHLIEKEKELMTEKRKEILAQQINESTEEKESSDRPTKTAETTK